MEHTRTITREFQTGEKAVLHVEARSGAVTVESHDQPMVLVEAVVHVWSDIPAEADDAASMVEHGIEQDGHRVIIRAPALPQSEGWSLWGGRRGARVDYAIRVPVATAVRVLSRSGRVEISGTRGRVHSESMSGRCSIRDVTGEVSVVTKSGSVTIGEIDGNVRAEAKSGRVEVVKVSGNATIEAKSGACDIRDVTGDIEIKAHTGSISIDDAHARVKAEAHTGAIRYRGEIRGDFDIRAHTGFIQLAVDTTRPFFIDAESHAGVVRSDLPSRRGTGPANGEGPRVRLRTHTGAIRLTRA